MIIPEHIAIIMDGNGRWAASQGKPRNYGHLKGAENVRRIALKAKELGVKVLTLYAFSTENWKRPSGEVNYLMSLPGVFLEKFLKELMENNIRIRTIGNIESLPDATVMVLHRAISDTAANTAMTLVFAVNYGSRADIAKAADACLKEGKTAVTEQDIADHLSTKEYPEIDLMIRTSLDCRLSNFLLWELSYAELYFTDKYWPEFDEEQLVLAIEEFNRRNRNFGGLKQENEDA